jgi:predicted RNA-binding protein YlxR (DUF448 family)
VTGETGPKSGLVRFVVGPGDTVVPDLAGRLPGRGFYVTAESEVLERAVAKRMFGKGARRPVSVPDDLIALIEAGLVRRVQEAVALARKSGDAVCGFEKVRSALATQRIAALMQASDGSERGKGKLWTPEGARWVGHMTAAELGRPFGRDRVIHAVVAAGTLGRRVVEEAAKLRGIRGERPTEGDDPTGRNIGRDTGGGDPAPGEESQDA